MVFADQRYNRYDKRSKLPKWVQQFMVDHHINLSTDMAVDAAKHFLRQLAQPVDKSEFAKALLDADAVAQLCKSAVAAATTTQDDSLKIKVAGSALKKQRT
jgi:DNA excision repair protein ERCC-2